MELEKLRKLHPHHWEKANAIRVLTLDAVAAANSGHSGRSEERRVGKECER